LFRSALAAIFAAFSLIGLEFAAGDARAASYTFDKRADISFIYNVGIVQQSGHLSDIDGVFQFDKRAPERGSIKAVIKTASLSAAIAEDILRGDDFFNVSSFPEIHFVSRSAKATGDNTAEFTGDLTIKGVTRPMTLKVVFQPQGAANAQGQKVTATARIKRSAFNMTAYSYIVDDDVDIEIKAVLREKK